MSLNQLNLQGLTKVEESIRIIREYEPPEGYYLGMSYGKDSSVLLDLAKRSGVKFDAHYCLSPIDPPELIKWGRENYPEVQVDRHCKNFWKLVLKKGLPMRQRRWCCEYIKEVGGKHRTCLFGIRADEGRSRKHYSILHEHTRIHKLWVLPILDWNLADVWSYIDENHIATSPLYEEVNRLGCVLCPMSGHKQALWEIQRFPEIAKIWRLYAAKNFFRMKNAMDDMQVRKEEYIDALIDWVKPFVDNDEIIQLPWNNPESHWQWWISRK